MPLQITFHQLQALVAVAEMGSFEAAGKRLGIAQSAISKHIGELEARCARSLLDRSTRPATLTMEGTFVLARAKDLLHQRTLIIEEFGRPTLLHRTVRIGITELAAQTWLPRFVEGLQVEFPLVTPQLEIGAMASELCEKVRLGELELAMISDSPAWTNLLCLPLGYMRCGWYARKDVSLPPGPLPIQQLMKYPLILQDKDSPAGQVVLHWLDRQQVRPDNVLTCNSFAALGGMTTAGLGIGCLPFAIAHESVASGLLKEVKTAPSIPKMRYVIVARTDSVTPFHRKIAALARKVCNYDRRYQEV